MSRDRTLTSHFTKLCQKTAQKSAVKKIKRLRIPSPQDRLDNGIVYIFLKDRKGNGLVLGMSVKKICHSHLLDHFSQKGSIRQQAEKMAVDELYSDV